MSIEISLPINSKSSNHDPISKKITTLPSTNMTDPADSYKRRVAHEETVKVGNNRYSTPVILEFAAVTKEKTINIA